MPRPGAGAALPGPRHGAAEPPARRAQPEPAARRAAHGEPDRQHRRRPRGALRPAHLAERDAGAAGGRRRRGAAAPDRDRRRAVLQVRALARRLLLEVPQRGALRAVGHRCAGHRTRLVRTGPKHDYCLRDLDRVRDGPTVRARPLLRRVQPGCGHPRDHPRDIRGWADVYPSTYPGNWIEVTGLRGCFAVVHRADPGNRIRESNEADNAGSRSSGCPTGPGRSAARVRRRRLRPCRPPPPPAPAPPPPTPPTGLDGSRARRQDRLRHRRHARDRPGDRPAPGRRGLRRRAVRARRRRGRSARPASCARSASARTAWRPT